MDDGPAGQSSAEPKTLLTLPKEILHHLYGFLHIKDVRRLRLACRLLGDIGACHALPEIIFYLHKTDVEAIRAIAHHPVYPRFVKRFVYVTDTLAPDLLPYNEYKNMRRRTERWNIVDRARNQSHRNRHSASRRHSHFKTPMHLARAELLQAEVKLDSEIRTSYQTYKRVHRAQCQMLEKAEDFAVLKEVIPLFPNLEDLLVSSDRGFREGPEFGKKSPFTDLFCHAHSELKPEGARQLTSVLEALAVAGAPDTIRLRSLRAGSLHYHFFLQPRFDAARIGHMLRHLTRFELMIDTDPELSLDLEELLGPGNVPEEDEDDMNLPWGSLEAVRCRRAMRKGCVRGLLACMPNLETLSIVFIYQDESDNGVDPPIYQASLSDLIPAGARWPNLEYLQLEIVETERAELMAFLLRHKESLLELHLKDVRFVSSSWLRFLPQLKEELGTTLMQDVLISGVVYGQAEDADEVNDTPHPMMMAGDQEWNLGDPDFEDGAGEDCLANQITDYLLKEDCTMCPLTKRNIGRDLTY